MKLRKQLLAAGAVGVLAAGGALAAAGTAHAAPGVVYIDTSVTASHGHVDQYTSFTATVAGSTATLNGNPDYFSLSAAAKIDFSAAGADGTTAYSIASTASLPSGVTAVLSPAGGVLSLTPNGDPIVLPANPVTITVRATDGSAVALDTVTLTPVSVFGHPFAVDLTAASDTVQLAHGAVNNVNGTVSFATTPVAGVTETLGNAPAGISLAGEVLTATSALPGTYHSVTVTGTDAAGATAVETFTATVDGARASTTAPRLYGGHAVSVTNNREQVFFGITEDSWVKFLIVGPGAINGHAGWVNAAAGLNTAYYSGLEAGHTYAVFYYPVTGQGSSTLVAGSRAGHVTFVTTRNPA